MDKHPKHLNHSVSGKTWSDRLARAFALFRGAVVIVFSVVLIAAPEQAMAGSSSEPTRTLALVFASRTILLGIAFIVLAIRRKREALAWVFLADSALQLFDTAMALATHKYALVVLPVAIGVVDAWAGLYLLRAARMSPASPAR